MSGNSFGTLYCITSFGESHGPAYGGVVDGCPPGMALTVADLQAELDRRKPGSSRHVTQRRETDTVEILSGVYEGKTTGTAIGFLIRNEDQRSKDYSAIAEKFRPGHADYTYWQKYGIRDARGGGRASARETVIRVAAGAIAKKWLHQRYGVVVRGYLAQLGPHPIAFNAIPEIDVFMPDGSTKEEWKIVAESRKILHLPDLRLACTAVRVPVFVSHSEAVHVETTRSIDPDRARALFGSVPGVIVEDDPGQHSYPLATRAAGRDEIFVGRVRRDASIAGGRGLSLWVVSDNLRKGAATNAIELAEVLVERGWVRASARRATNEARA